MTYSLDKEIEDFVQEYVDSFITWDLLVLYHENPELKDSVSGLANRLGRKETDVEKGVKDLLHKKILKEAPSGTVYLYTPSSDLAEKIGKFVSALNIRENRLLILSVFLQKDLG